MKYHFPTPLAFLITAVTLSAATTVVPNTEATPTPTPTEPVTAGTTTNAAGTSAAAPAPTDPVVTGSVVITARQVTTITVTGAINKADHSVSGDHDNDGAEFRSGVGSLFTKATSAIGEAFKPDSTSTGSMTTTITGKSAAGQVAIPGRDGVGLGIGVMMAGLVGFVGAGLVL